MSQEGGWGKEEGHSGPSLLGACLEASLGLRKTSHETHQNGEGLHGLRGSVSHLRGGSHCLSSGEGRQGQLAVLGQRGRPPKTVWSPL